jgi:ABC-type uncharacterized transport system ATPase subunit
LSGTANLPLLKSIEGVERVRLTDEGCELGLAAGVDPGAVMRAVVTAMPVARMELARVRLEDVFIRLVSGEAAVDETGAQALRTHLQGHSGAGVAA